MGTEITVDQVNPDDPPERQTLEQVRYYDERTLQHTEEGLHDLRSARATVQQEGIPTPGLDSDIRTQFGHEVEEARQVQADQQAITQWDTDHTSDIYDDPASSGAGTPTGGSGGEYEPDSI
jgi:hypothetical protein